jgi:hypothetical protein
MINLGIAGHAPISELLVKQYGEALKEVVARVDQLRETPAAIC